MAPKYTTLFLQTVKQPLAEYEEFSKLMDSYKSVTPVMVSQELVKVVKLMVRRTASAVSPMLIPLFTGAMGRRRSFAIRES